MPLDEPSCLEECNKWATPACATEYFTYVACAFDAPLASWECEGGGDGASYSGQHCDAEEDAWGQCFSGN